jgi:hypothetical protein
MQHAWRARFGIVSAEAIVQPAGEAATSTSGSNLDTARRPTANAKHASRKAAEELSHRFDAGGTESTADGGLADASVPLVSASINTNADPNGGAEPAERSQASEDEAHHTIGAWKESIRVSEDISAERFKPASTKPAGGGDHSVPSSRRQRLAPAEQDGTPFFQLLTDYVAVDPPETDPMQPREMRAFGWNAQP